MEILAIVLFTAYSLLAVGVRALIQVARTGSSGLNGWGSAGVAELLAGVGGALANGTVGVGAPVLALLGVVEPIEALDTPLVGALGVMIAVGAIALIFYFQLAMGTSWRIGVDPEERTELVVTGPFALVRNPIYSAMLLVTFGLALAVPSWIAFAGFAGFVVAQELLVRKVEEPYLLGAHGAAYSAYAARAGRFVPGVGRLNRS